MHRLGSGAQARHKRWPCTLLFLFVSVVISTVEVLEVNAMITIIETHETFASTVDNYYGRSLMTGYEYYSRLQMITPNPSLCPPQNTLSSISSSSSFVASFLAAAETNYSVIVPSDQLPVTLLVSNQNQNSSSSDGCTLVEKIQYALTHIEPIGRVKYLIVATSSEEEEEEAEVANRMKIWNTDDRFVVADVPPTKRNLKQWRYEIQRAARKTYETLLRRHRKNKDKKQEKKNKEEEKDKENHKPHTDIPLYIIHVSIMTYNDLYSIIQRQTESTLLEGGTQISIDNNRHSHRYYGGNGDEQNETLLYTALIAFITAGVCFFIILLCGSNDWDDDEAANPNNTNQPPRPTRQRLTKEQVRQLFPIYRYDGESKLYRIVPVPSVSTVASPEPSSDTLHQPLLSSSPSTSDTEAFHQQEVIHNMLLDVCSICLDEYEVHDKIRMLPCHHTFHSKCVGRWLSERSAVCPLCKENLYIDPEPVETENENDVTTTADVNNNAANDNTNNTTTEDSTTVSFNSVWRRFMEHLAMPPTAVPTTTASRSTTATAPNGTPTTNELLNSNTVTDVEMPIVTPLVESTATATETTTSATPSRISSSWWSRMFPQTSSSSLNVNGNSLTEPLLQQSAEVADIEASNVAESTYLSTSGTPLSSVPAAIPIEDDRRNDSVAVTTEASVSPSSSVAAVPHSSESTIPNHTDDEITRTIVADDRANYDGKSDTITSNNNNNDRTVGDVTVIPEVPDPLLTRSTSQTDIV